jgi:biopolymer transport protein ExbB
MPRSVVAVENRPFQLLLYVVSLALFLVALAASVRAQDDGADLLGQPAAAAPAAAPAAAGNPPAAGDAPTKPEESLLSWFIGALGWPYVVTFFSISFVYISLLVMCILAARRESVCPEHLIEAFEEKLNEKDFQGAYDLASTDESVLGKVLSAGLSKVSKGYPKALEGMQEVGEDESMKLEHRLSYISLIGNISPMVGLLGTVDGMVRSFQVIATSGSTPKPAELAGGISTALITTLVGLLIAIPAILSYNLIRNRIVRLLLEVGMNSENLMSRFEDTQPKAPVKKPS